MVLYHSYNGRLIMCNNFSLFQKVTLEILNADWSYNASFFRKKIWHYLFFMTDQIDYILPSDQDVSLDG